MAMQPSPSAQRTVEVVRFLSEHSGESFSTAEIARRVGQSRATCQAVLLALEAADWVRRRASGGYTLGAGLIAVGAAAQRGVGVVELLRAAVHTLHDDLGYEVTGCLPAGTQLTVVARSGPSDPFAAATLLGQAYPMVPPAGLAFAAWDETDLREWIGRAPDLDERARNRLRRAAALVRELGYAVSLDGASRRSLNGLVTELTDGRGTELRKALAHDECVMVEPGRRRWVRGAHLSVPVFGADERVVGLLGVTVPSDEADRLLTSAGALRDQARLLAAGLQVPAGA